MNKKLEIMSSQPVDDYEKKYLKHIEKITELQELLDLEESQLFQLMKTQSNDQDMPVNGDDLL